MRWLTALLARRRERAANEDLRAAREKVRRLRERLVIEKRKRARLEERLALLRRGGAPVADLEPAVPFPDGRRLLVFDHIPKTAGTTFRRAYLTAALPRDERWILSGGDANEEERQQFLALPEKRRRRYRVVAGHYAETLRPYLPQARFVTVVREPVARTISEYLHVMYHDSAPAAAAWAASREENITLGQYVERNGRHDVQSRTLLGEAHDTLAGRSLEEYLESRYALVGYTDALDEFVFLLHVTEELPLCLYRNRLVRAERASYAPSPEDLDLVTRATAADARLYRVVRERFDARLAALSPEAQAKLGRWKAALDEFRKRTDGVDAVRLPDDW